MHRLQQLWNFLGPNIVTQPSSCVWDFAYAHSVFPSI